MSSEQEKKNQLLGVLTSVSIHLLLIALFLFVMGFTAPNPPLSELGSGVQLQLGVDDTGSGDVQQEVPVTPADTQEQNTPEEARKTEAEPVDQPKTSEPKAEELKPKEELASDEESPVTAKEVRKEDKKEKKETKVDLPKEKPIVKKPEKAIAEYKAPQEKEVKPDTKDTGAKKDGDDKARNSKGISQGDDKGKTGDKGRPEGVPDLKGQYSGKSGTGGAGAGGGGISVSGFNGFEKPRIVSPDVPEDSYGTYEFLVKVNSEGDIEKITPLTRGLSLEAENIFKKLIQNTEFVPLNSNLPASSEGRITFKIVAGKKP